MTTTSPTGSQLAEQGMARAAAKADALDDGWNEKAFQFVRGFATVRAPNHPNS